LTPERRGREEAGDVGMFPVFRTLVQDVQPDTPALKAGIKPGDEIIRVNGVDLRTSGRTLQQTIQQIAAGTFPITVLREGKEVELQVSPMLRDGRKMIGIGIQTPSVHIKLGVTDAF